MKVAIGATGAPTLSRGKGVASIVRNSAGNYTITLNDSYNALLNVIPQFVAASGPAAPLVSVVSESVDSAKTIVIQCADIAEAATDPANGETLLLTLSLANAP
jgi:hypothetical protein